MGVESQLAEKEGPLDKGGNRISHHSESKKRKIFTTKKKYDDFSF